MPLTVARQSRSFTAFTQLLRFIYAGFLAKRKDMVNIHGLVGLSPAAEHAE
jgi:hypothetical protein